MSRWLHEPMLHFFVLGALVFALFAVFDDTPSPVAENRLVISEADARQLVAEFQGVWRRLPTEDELTYMIEQRIREEVYVREALALGLDRDDAVIRRRLQTKMEFLTESGAEAANPDEATLQAHLEQHADRFTVQPRVAFEQVMLDDAISDDEAGLVLVALNGGADPAAVAQSTLLPPQLQATPRQAVDGTFGTGFFDALARLPEGQWAGPVTSGLGRHLVRVTMLQDRRVPQLSEIRAQVERDWRTRITEQLREDRLQALLSRYEVSYPEAAQILEP
ncbi:MAG: peptidylprolyl isomerase [Pseudomonadota bacterium]